MFRQATAGTVTLEMVLTGAEGGDIRAPGSFCQIGSKILLDEY